MSNFEQQIFNVLCETNNIEKINIEFLKNHQKSTCIDNELIKGIIFFAIFIAPVAFITLDFESQYVLLGIAVIFSLICIIYNNVKNYDCSEKHYDLYDKTQEMLQDYASVKAEISESEFITYIRKKSYDSMKKRITAEDIREYMK